MQIDVIFKFKPGYSDYKYECFEFSEAPSEATAMFTMLSALNESERTNLRKISAVQARVNIRSILPWMASTGGQYHFTGEED